MKETNKQTKEVTKIERNKDTARKTERRNIGRKERKVIRKILKFMVLICRHS